MGSLVNIQLQYIKRRKYIEPLLKLGSLLEEDDIEGLFQSRDNIKKCIIEGARFERAGLIGAFSSGELIGFCGTTLKGKLRDEAYVQVLINRHYVKYEIFKRLLEKSGEYCISKKVKRQYTRLRQNQKHLINLFELSRFYPGEYSIEMVMDIKNYHMKRTKRNDLSIEIFNDTGSINSFQAAAVADLMNDGFRYQPGDEKFTLEQVYWMLNGYYNVLACVDDIPVGMGSIQNIPDRSCGYICNLVVKSSWRRKGIGRWILIKLIEEAKQMGNRSVELTVNGENYNAYKLYKSAGFGAVNRITTYSRDFINAGM